MDGHIHDVMEEIKGQSYMSSFPLDDFESIDELKKFIERAGEKHLRVAISEEHSNFYQGMLVNVYDPQTICCKDKLFK